MADMAMGFRSARLHGAMQAKRSTCSSPTLVQGNVETNRLGHAQGDAQLHRGLTTLELPNDASVDADDVGNSALAQA
jgi:hypothetical protein